MSGRSLALALLAVFACPAFAAGPEQVFDLVYQIKTATDASAPKATYGSGFVVEADGLLATNFHVVSTALHEPKKYNLYLVDGPTITPAEVVAFDVVNDLALVKVQKAFPGVVKFAKKNPEAGAKVYSIGLPEDLNKSVIEGNFNGLMRHGPYERLQLSMPLNAGMSGGPMLNSQGEIIGVNVSIRIDSQNLAFGIPAHAVEALLQKERHGYGDPDAKEDFDDEVRDQLDLVQEQLTTLLVKGSQPIGLGPWQVAKPTEGVKCWRDTDTGTKDLSVQTTENCYLPGTSPVRPDHDTGTFRIKYSSVSSTKLNDWQFVGLLNESLQQSSFAMADYVERFTTRFSCSEMDLLNAHQVPLRVHYCVSAYVRYSEIYNMEVEVVTLGKEQSALIVSASLLGFSSRSLTDITKKLVNSVKNVGGAP